MITVEEERGVRRRMSSVNTSGYAFGLLLIPFGDQCFQFARWGVIFSLCDLKSANWGRSVIVPPGGRYACCFDRPDNDAAAGRRRPVFGRIRGGSTGDPESAVDSRNRCLPLPLYGRVPVPPGAEHTGAAGAAPARIRQGVSGRSPGRRARRTGEYARCYTGGERRL